MVNLIKANFIMLLLGKSAGIALLLGAGEMYRGRKNMQEYRSEYFKVPT
jgi:hypothetical protein